MRLLIEWGANVVYNDPIVPKFLWQNEYIESAELTEELLNSVDIAVLITGHSQYDYNWIAKNAPLIYDSRNAFEAVPDPDGKIATLGT